jgi:hypothetical protein
MYCFWSYKRPTPCNNGCTDWIAFNMTRVQTKMLAWIVIAMLAAAVTYATFLGYLSPELLLGFANTFSC